MLPPWLVREQLHEVKLDAHGLPHRSYLDPHCALGSRGTVQEHLQVPSEKRRGDHTGTVPTGKGASVVWKHTGKVRLEKGTNQKSPAVDRHFFLNSSVC